MCRLHPVHPIGKFHPKSGNCRFSLCKWGLNSAVALDVFGAIIACITVAMVHIPKQPIEALQQENFFTELRIGYNAIRQNKALFTLLWIGAINMFIYMPINALFPLMSMNYFEGSTLHASWWKLFLQLVCCWADFYWAHGEVSKSAWQISSALSFLWECH